MSERDLFLTVVRLIIGLGLVCGFLFLRPRVGQERVRGGRALLVRLVVALYLLLIVGYYGFFLRWFQRELFGN